MVSQLTLDVGEYHVRIVQDPATSINGAELTALKKGSIPVAKKAFENDRIPDTDVILHAINVTHGIYVSHGRQLVAFSSATPIETQLGLVSYMEGTAIHPS